jgi:hypothetical protein
MADGKCCNAIHARKRAFRHFQYHYKIQNLIFFSNASILKHSTSYTKPSALHRKVLYLVLSGPHVQMSFGTNYSAFQVSVTGTPYLASLLAVSLHLRHMSLILLCLHLLLPIVPVIMILLFRVLKDDAEALPSNISSCVEAFSMVKLLGALECCCNMSPDLTSI